MCDCEKKMLSHYLEYKDIAGEANDTRQMSLTGTGRYTYIRKVENLGELFTPKVVKEKKVEVQSQNCNIRNPVADF